MKPDSRPLLVVDLVGTLEDNWSAKRQWFLARGIEFPLWQPPRAAIVGVVGEDAYAAMKRAMATEESIPNDPPIEGSANALRGLRHHFRIAVLSTRAARLRAPTEQFLQRHFSGLWDRLELLGDADGRTSVRKQDWCFQNGAAAFVEDDDRHLHGLEGRGILPILLNLNNRPMIPPKGAILAPDWAAIARILSESGLCKA